jgi:AGZA family xanthine/uracil permease-like MFS transporter
VGLDKMMQTGVLYHGMELMGGGAILGGLVLAAIGVFVIDRQLHKAALSAAIGGALTFFGFMHGEAIGVGKTPVVAMAYLTVAALLLACAKFAPAAALEPEPEHDEAHGVPAPAE